MASKTVLLLRQKMYSRSLPAIHRMYRRNSFANKKRGSIKHVHSKIVIGDEGLLCIGSFNWFSATRVEKYQRYDTSVVYRGENLKDEIQTIYANLDRRTL